jgi:hypothetical protein
MSIDGSRIRESKGGHPYAVGMQRKEIQEYCVDGVF